MTTISRDDVSNLARLSNLALTDAELDALSIDLGQILEYVNQLAELDTEGVEPTYQVTGLENVMRDDEIKAGISGQHLVTLASESKNDQIKVPKVL